MPEVINTLNNTGVVTHTQMTGEKAAEFNHKTLLTRLKPKLQLMPYGQKSNIPKHAGDLAKWRRFNSLTVSKTAITEGVTPDATTATVSVVSATVKEYGNWIETTDVMDIEAIDPVMTQYSELMGENAGESMESITLDIVVAGTNVVYAGGKTSTDTIASTDKITELDVLKIRRALVRNKAPKIKLPNGKMGYVALFHTDVITDMVQLQDYKDDKHYANPNDLIEGITAEWHGIYFIEYDLAVKAVGAGAGGTVDVYKNIILGKEAFGVPGIEGVNEPELIVKKPGSSGVLDPLNQRGSCGWKVFMTGVRLNELTMVRYECAATA
jgi:N4-gp56 family major capsid protein